MANFSFSIINVFCNLLEKHLFFISGASPDIKINLSQERIYALLSAKVFHVNANEANDVDCICTPPTIECLSGYGLKPSFNDPVYSTTILIAYQEINHLRKLLSDNYDIAQQHNVSILSTGLLSRLELKNFWLIAINLKTLLKGRVAPKQSGAVL